ncbi:MAG: hypothetical protein ACI30R_08390 [Sodaliphilus sp.]
MTFINFLFRIIPIVAPVPGFFLGGQGKVAVRLLSTIWDEEALENSRAKSIYLDSISKNLPFPTEKSDIFQERCFKMQKV